MSSSHIDEVVEAEKALEEALDREWLARRALRVVEDEIEYLERILDVAREKQKLHEKSKN